MGYLTDLLLANRKLFHPVVTFDRLKDKLLLLDFTSANTDLTASILNNTEALTTYLTNKLQSANCKYGIGGYNEHRTIYSRSEVFNNDKNVTTKFTNANTSEPRRLHLGIDIWGTIGTDVFAPLDGVVHSFAFNKAYGDYGATIILQHQLNSTIFYTLYGHLALANIKELQEGQPIAGGQLFAQFGRPEENGHWPPHLHFQVIADMQGLKGDYPGVCKFSEREKYLMNCPDPDLVLGMMRFAEPYSGS